MGQGKALTIAGPVSTHDHNRHATYASSKAIEFIFGVGLNHEDTNTVCLENVDQIRDRIKTEVPCAVRVLSRSDRA